MPYSSVTPLVSADWLYEHQGDDNLVIFDCRWRLTNPQFGAQAFAHGHIPGARFLDLGRVLSDPPGDYGGRHPLPNPRKFQETMQSLGVSTTSHIVAYDDEGSAAARCWWLLNYFGHEWVHVLDGGLNAWTRCNYPISTTIDSLNSRVADPFVSRPDPTMVVDYATVAHLREHYPIIDARAPERYAGRSEPVDRLAGHIPGADNVPYHAVFNPTGQYRPAEELRRLLSPWLSQSSSPIVYCGSGVTACINILAMRLAGASPLLYPGSWSDWIQHVNAPISPQP